MFARIDTHSKSTYHLHLTNRWMALRMRIFGPLFAFCVAVFVASVKGIGAPLAGFALSFALDYSNTTTDTIRHYAGLELKMNSTERVVEYTTMEIEDQTGADVPASRPTVARISVRGLEAGYAADLPSVLKGLTFNVEPGQRVGVVGRTGSGIHRSHLRSFAFLKLAKARSMSMGLIPQDPMLFSGTMRSYLDPFDERSNTELRNASKRVYLLDHTIEPELPRIPGSIPKTLISSKTFLHQYHKAVSTSPRANANSSASLALSSQARRSSSSTKPQVRWIWVRMQLSNDPLESNLPIAHCW